jgi:hypothetical protein
LDRDIAGPEIFAKWVTLPIVGHEDPSEIGMTIEDNTE